MSHIASDYSNITVGQRITPSLRVCRFFSSTEELNSGDLKSSNLLLDAMEFENDESLWSWRLRVALRIAPCRLLQESLDKTGAYSPPRFSAPVLKVSRNPGEPGRSSTFGQLVRGAEAGENADAKALRNQDALRLCRRSTPNGGAVFT